MLYMKKELKEWGNSGGFLITKEDMRIENWNFGDIIEFTPIRIIKKGEKKWKERKIKR